MQNCGKQMGVLALNAAIEAGRMGEGGKQFVTAAETIRVSAGTYDELIDQAHKRLADSDERIAELEGERFKDIFQRPAGNRPVKGENHRGGKKNQ